MKVKDFETAIASLDTFIVLDEVRIHKGHVRKFFGHTEDKHIMWNEFGLGFSCVQGCNCERNYCRDDVYDLSF